MCTLNSNSKQSVIREWVFISTAGGQSQIHPQIPYTIMIVVAMDFNKKNSRCSIVAAADSVMNSIIFKVIV